MIINVTHEKIVGYQCPWGMGITSETSWFPRLKVVDCDFDSKGAISNDFFIATLFRKPVMKNHSEYNFLPSSE